MRKNRIMTYVLSFAVLAAACILLAGWNLCSGSVSLSVGEILGIFSGAPGNETASRILWDIRLPRILSAAILGGALAVSGFLLQTFFANPVASPFMLGISSGAELAVSLLMILFLGRGISISSLALIFAAFAGAMTAMGFVLLISSRVRDMSALVICGVMTGYLCSAVTDFFITFANDADIVNLRSWSMGSFSGMSWENVKVMAAVVFLAFLGTLFLSKPMGAYQLGEVYARSMGVNVKRFRAELILLSSVLSACVVAFAGPVSFVGLAAPQLVKRMFGTAKPLIIIPGCFLGGAGICLLCDLIARTVFAPTELAISSVTAAFGAPVVVYMLVKSRRREQ